MTQQIQEDVAREVTAELQANAQVIGRNALRDELLAYARHLREQGYSLDLILGLVVLDLSTKEPVPHRWWEE